MLPRTDLGWVRPSSRVATVSGEDVARGQAEWQTGKRFIAAVDLGARWAAGILFAVMVVAQAAMYLGR